MISSNEFGFVTKTVFDLLKFTADLELIPVETEGVFVSLKGRKAEIGARSKILAARAAMLLALRMRKGETEFEMQQTPHFDSCGALLDVSSGAALRVDAIKKYLSYMAALGMNTMYFYTEDMYELADYPHFGYMRGRYTISELREIDDYAYSLGIEVIPCIETLAHMQHYLRWKEAAPVTDAYDTLLCGSEDTYKLIDAMVKTMHRAFRSRRINVGLDEAFNMGKGQYAKKNGTVDRNQIFLSHVDRVSQICEKYGFRPVMWSDMLFVMKSKNGKYNDRDVEFDKEFKDRLPNVDLVYWEYEVTDEDTYDFMLKKHKSLGKRVIFAGSVWTFLNFLPSVKKTMAAGIPALKACLKNGIADVFATIWGGDGAECPHFMTISGLPVFSEYCYRGLGCAVEDIREVMEFVTGFDYDHMMLISGYDNIMGRKHQGRTIWYGDIFWGPLGKEFDYSMASRLYGETLERIRNKNCAFDEFHKLSILLFEILQIKCPLFYLRKPYHEGNREMLENSVGKISRLIVLYKELWELHYEIWDKYCKIFGWEVHSARYASMLARLEYTRKVITEYLDGKRDKIEELEQKLEDAVSVVPIPIYNRLTFTPFPIV